MKTLFLFNFSKKVITFKSFFKEMINFNLFLNKKGLTTRWNYFLTLNYSKKGLTL